MSGDMPGRTRVLVIAAHPDDEVLGAGGTIIQYARRGAEVTVAVLTDGAATRYSRRMAGVLRKNCLACGEILGTREIIFLDLPNQKLDSLPLFDVIRPIESVIEKVRPHVLFVHHGGDLNQDHRLAYEACMVAGRPLPGTPIRAILSYAVASSTEWNCVSRERAFVPNVFVDISDVLEDKIRAFRRYRSEQRPYPHPRSLRALRVAAQQTGISAGLRAAEGFMLVRGIGTP